MLYSGQALYYRPEEPACHNEEMLRKKTRSLESEGTLFCFCLCQFQEIRFSGHFPYPQFRWKLLTPAWTIAGAVLFLNSGTMARVSGQLREIANKKTFFFSSAEAELEERHNGHFLCQGTWVMVFWIFKTESLFFFNGEWLIINTHWQALPVPALLQKNIFLLEPTNNSVKYAFEGILCSIITIKYSESKDHKKIYSLLSEWVGPPLSTLPPLCLLTQIFESVPLTLAGLRGSPWASLSLSLFLATLQGL